MPATQITQKAVKSGKRRNVFKRLSASSAAKACQQEKIALWKTPIFAEKGLDREMAYGLATRPRQTGRCPA
jgi:hypothetical protein